MGVLQGLARFSDPKQSQHGGLMYELDYLSTVSGGGYIGSWLMAWIDQRRRAPHEAFLKKVKKLEKSLNKFKPSSEEQSESVFQNLKSKLQKSEVEPKEKSNKLLDELIADVSPLKGADKEDIRKFEKLLQSIRKTIGSPESSQQQKNESPKQQLKGQKQELEKFRKSFQIPVELSKTAYAKVISAIAGDETVTAGDAEQPPVRHLRSYTSYLAPSVGFTLDTFTLAAIFSRNLLINWLMLIPAIITVISGTRLLGLMTKAYQGTEVSWATDFIMIAFIMAAIVAATCLPSHGRRLRPGIWPLVAPVFRILVVAASWFLTIWKIGKDLKFFHWDTRTISFLIALISFIVVAVSIGIAHWLRLQRIPRRTWGWKTLLVLFGLIAVGSASLLTMWLLYEGRKLTPILLHTACTVFKHCNDEGELFIIFALPLTITIIMATTTVFCAMLGLFELEEDREWWARNGGALLIFNLLWIAAQIITFWGPAALHGIISGVAGLMLGLAGSLVGYSGATAGSPRPVKVAQIGSFGRFLEKHHLLLPVIGAVSIFLITLGIVAVGAKVREAIQQPGTSNILFVSESNRLEEILLREDPPIPTTLLPVPHNQTQTKEQTLHHGDLAVFLSAFIFSVFINLVININIFSLHGLYRMRLMRAFLGASNICRRPDPSTNFDPKDTPYESDLPACPGIPLHIINATLNLTGTSNTAWKQRRAESFTISPIQCGAWRVGYVKSDVYGGMKGMTLATAMAISGAAFNPNMGYQTSAVLSFLMTFFNLRLGCWMPNPKRSTPKMGLGLYNQMFFRQPGPTFALRPLIAEIAGLTDDENRWIELTDGGHFENLGLYEMVMRRVKHIVVVDAGADPLCQFEDLGNAIRKIQIDLGIPIIFPTEMKMYAGVQKYNSYCAVASIQYSCVDQGQTDGQLVYIKAGLSGEEPADILQYAKTHPTFPHETTGNQFFNESQFESYRHLGSVVIDRITATSTPPMAPLFPVPPTARSPFGSTMQQFAQAAQVYWASIPKKL
jgi:hypothetical protein